MSVMMYAKPATLMANGPELRVSDKDGNDLVLVEVPGNCVIGSENAAALIRLRVAAASLVERRKAHGQCPSCMVCDSSIGSFVFDQLLAASIELGDENIV